MKYDKYTNILYLTFRTVSDLICLNINDKCEMEKQALYNGKDTFIGFDINAKNSVKTREINRCVKLGKNRIQQLTHTKGGKIIYKTLPKNARKADLSSEDYFDKNMNKVNTNFDKTKLVPIDFKEEKKRQISLFLHITGEVPKQNSQKYYDLVCSKTINAPLGRNIVNNKLFLLFPSNPLSGGGLGIINIDKLGKRKQIELRCHKETMTCFDICSFTNNVITGSSDARVYIHNIASNIFDKKSDGKPKELQILKFEGKVSFCAFNPFIKNLCVIGARTNSGNSLYLYNATNGKQIKKIEINNDNVKDINDIVFEPTGNQTLCAVSSQDKYVRLIDLINNKILFKFKPLECMKDIKLFWINNYKLLCLGFRKGSLRAFGVYDVSDIVNAFYNNDNDNDNDNNDEEKNNDDDIDEDNNDNDDDDKEEKKEDESNVDLHQLRPDCDMTFGVSNSQPIGYYDRDSNLFYFTSVGDRNIRIIELQNNNNNDLREMNKKCNVGEEIIGISPKAKQYINVNRVEIGYLYVLTRKEILPIPFTIPRKRREYFQDDLYLNNGMTINIEKETITLDNYIKLLNNENNNIKFELNMISLKPENMIKLSDAPKEELTERQKRRKSDLKNLEKDKLKEKPQSTAQAFEAFSRMVADAPTNNQWDAQPIASEVADDEWSD